MERFLHRAKKLLTPPLWVIITLSVISAAALAAVFIKGWEETWGAYAVFAVSAYTLTVMVLYLIKALPRWHKNARERVLAHSFGGRCMTDGAFKVQVSLYISLAINLLFSAVKLTGGILYSSLWLGAMAVYYMLLALIRFLLLHYMHRGEGREILHEWERYRLCGMIMLVLHLSLTGIVFQMVRDGQGAAYPGVMIFVVAAYAFYSVTVSVIDILRSRKDNRPVISAAKAVRFGAACVSVLTMETAMLAQFGDDGEFNLIITAATGAAVCVTVLALSVYMTVRATVKIKELKALGEGEKNGEQ